MRGGKALYNFAKITFITNVNSAAVTGSKPKARTTVNTLAKLPRQGCKAAERAKSGFTIGILF